MNQSLTIVIPCLNEEAAIASVIEDYRETFPESDILVIDNGSTDQCGAVALEAGARVIQEPRPGKARAVATAFESIDSDLVIMTDGDGSYPASGARLLLNHYHKNGGDMITGIRTPDSDGLAFRPLHQTGTRAFALGFSLVFGYQPQDIFSGLRLMSRRFYKNMPILSRGFGLEMELSIQAVEKQMQIAEITIPFRERADGTASKLRTVRDGLRILLVLILLFRDYRPLVFFGVISLTFFSASLIAGVLPIQEYLNTGYVGRFPLAVLAASFMIISLFTMQTGIILESTLRHAREAHQLTIRRFR